MTTAIQMQPQSIQPFFSSEQEKMILSSFLGGASKQEAAVLMEVARVRRLNPLLRQIHFVNRWDAQKGEKVWSYQTSIDGLRAIAERTGRYLGQTKAEWCGKDGAWRDVWLSDEHPVAARVGVHKQGFLEPCYGVAKWSAFVQTKKDGGVTSFWARMGDLMLAKCAEALAIRRAFPEDTSGLYTDDEMGTEVEAHPVEHVAVATTYVAPTTSTVSIRATVAPAPLDPGVDLPSMTVEPPQPEDDDDSDEVPQDRALRDAILAAGSLGQLVLTLPAIKKLPPPLDAEVMDAYRARRDALKGGK